jgi:hypothetical protein
MDSSDLLTGNLADSTTEKESFKGDFRRYFKTRRVKIQGSDELDIKGPKSIGRVRVRDT